MSSSPDLSPCERCGVPLLDGLPFCPHCGAKQPPPLSHEDISRDPYKILQVARDAEPEVIDAAYRSLSKKYHPDVQPPRDSDERMKEINWAHELLTDPDKRRAWDTKARFRPSDTQPRRRSQAPPPSGAPRADFGQQTPQPPYGPPPPQRKSGATGCLILLAIAVCSFAIFLVSSSISSSSSPTTASPIPSLTVRTLPPTRIPTVRSSIYREGTVGSALTGDSCYSWDQVTDRLIGSLVCVYGTVVKLYDTDNYAQIIRFSEDAGTFLIRGTHYYFEEVRRGDCVMVQGVVRRDGNYLLMVTDEDSTRLSIGPYCGP